MTSDELALLEEHAIPVGQERWTFCGGGLYSAEDALAITKSCLLLEDKVDSTISAKAWTKIVTKLFEVEARLNNAKL